MCARSRSEVACEITHYANGAAPFMGYLSIAFPMLPCYQSGLTKDKSIQLKFLPAKNNNMEMIGILPRYNTMKCQLQSMSGTF